MWVSILGQLTPQISHSVTDQGPVELLGAKAFLCPPFLVLRKWASFSLHGLPSLSYKEQVQIVADQRRKRMKGQRRDSQETIVQPRGRILIPPQGMHIMT